MTTIGWEQSAPGWIAALGTEGDATRRHVLDAPMCAALPARGAALDLGCGEGRFCRLMAARGLQTTGRDPTAALLQTARARDPAGRYDLGTAEALPYDDAEFDAVVFYLSLINIPDFRAAISEGARVLRPGGRMLIANLTPHATARPRDWAGEGSHWVYDGDRPRYLACDDIQRQRRITTAWGEIRVENHHRPLSAYMTALLEAGLCLTQFTDPPFTGPDGETKDKFTRMPWAFMMVWAKPEARS